MTLSNSVIDELCDIKKKTASVFHKSSKSMEKEVAPSEDQNDYPLSM